MSTPFQINEANTAAEKLAGGRPASQPEQSLRVCRTRGELSVEVARLRAAGLTIGLVPTMGALHEGHLSLVRASASACEATIVTIFVNPTQFAAGEDLQDYPRTFEEDLNALANTGATAVFVPENDEIYPSGFSTFVQPPAVARRWEGQARPEHFQGVATIVLKLIHLTHPDVVWLGQKDLQQVRVLEAMIRDLNVPVLVRMLSTVRDEDGLALSSRNRKLDESARPVAAGIYKALLHVQRAVREGLNDVDRVESLFRQSLVEHQVTEIDYAVAVDPRTLEPLTHIIPPVALLVAARVGGVRLIDNLIVH